VSQAARSTEQRVGPQKESAQTDHGATQVTLARGGAGAKRQGDTTGRAQRRRRGGSSGRDRKSLRMRPVEVERPPTGSGASGVGVGRLVHKTAHPPTAAGRQPAPTHTGTRWLPCAAGRAPRVSGRKPGVACNIPVAKEGADRQILRGARVAPP